MKARQNKLDRFAAKLADMDAEKKTLAEMQAWLAESGCRASSSAISVFLERQRSSRRQAELLAQIASGARQSQEVEKQFGRTPPPALDTLIKLQRVVLLNIATKAGADPELLKLVATTFSSVMESERIKIKRDELELGKRKMVLMEKKAAAYDRTQAALTEVKQSKGGITPETLRKIETELRLL